MEITLHVGKPAAFRVKVLQTEREIFLTGPEVDKAQKNPITEENVRKCFGKLGDTFFAVSPEQMHIEMDADCFYPLKTMNELRRQGMEKLLKLYYPIERTENKAEEVPAQENTAAPDGRTGQAGKDTASECAAGQRKAAANGQEHAVLVQKKSSLLLFWRVIFLTIRSIWSRISGTKQVLWERRKQMLAETAERKYTLPCRLSCETRTRIP